MIYWTVCGPHGNNLERYIWYKIQPCTQVKENEKSCRVEFVDLREEKVSLMRMKVSDYIAQKLVDEGITDALL